MKIALASRRMLLQGAGRATLAIPFLPSLLKGTAHAASVAPKYVHINSNLNLPRALTYPLYFNPYPVYPQPPGTTPDSVPWTQKDADTKFQSLADIIKYQGKLSYVLDERWNPFAARMNLITNAHAYVGSNKHNCGVSAACSSGTGPLGTSDIEGPRPGFGYSADWLIEQAWAKSSPAPLSALRLNLYESDGGYVTFAFGGAGTTAKLPMMQSLPELGLKVMGATPPDNGRPGQPNPAIVNRIARIDSVLDDFKAVSAHPRLSSLDRKRLGDAGDMWRDVEKRLQAAGTTARGCSIPAASAAAMDWGTRHRAAMDTIAAALACGLTRVVSYGLIQAGDTMHDQGTMHGWEHDPRSPGEVDPKVADPYFSLVRWRSNLVTSFLQKLDALKDETGQSLLGSSLVVWGHQFSDMGHSMLGHTLISVGGANGKLDTGWHVDAGGAPVNRFHLTNMMAMGLGLPDIEKSGTPGFGEVTTIISTGDNSFAPILHEQDAKSNDKTKRQYDAGKKDYFAAAAQMRKPFAYLRSGT